MSKLYNFNEPWKRAEEKEMKTILVQIEVEVPSNEEYDLQKLINMTTAYAGSILKDCRTDNEEES